MAMWLYRHPWVAAFLLIAAFGSQISPVFTRPWQGDFDQWFGIFAIVAVVLTPLAFLYKRWRLGPDGWAKFKVAIFAEHEKGRKLSNSRTLLIVIGVLLFVIFNLLQVSAGP